MRFLESLGYHCVRSAGSHTPVDIVADSATESLRIQVKVGAKPPAKEHQRLLDWETPPGVRKFMHHWVKEGREWRLNAVELAPVAR